MDGFVKSSGSDFADHEQGRVSPCNGPGKSGMAEGLFAKPLDFGGERMEPKDFSMGEDLLRSNVADFERHIIASALKRTGGNQSEAAKQLGTTKRILMYRIHKYGIDINAFRPADGKRNERKDPCE